MALPPAQCVLSWVPGAISWKFELQPKPLETVCSYLSMNFVPRGNSVKICEDFDLGEEGQYKLEFRLQIPPGNRSQQKYSEVGCLLSCGINVLSNKCLLRKPFAHPPRKHTLETFVDWLWIR